MNFTVKPATRFRPLAAATLLLLLTLTPMPAPALEKPDMLIEETVQSLLDQFTSQREVLEADKRELFALVDRIAEPLFDFERISKLVLAGNWKRASEQQRREFAEEFKKLLISTYATALFQYTGNETITFTNSEITERKGRQFAKVTSEVRLGSGEPPIPVIYSLMLGKRGGENSGWKIYNLTIDGLNMIVNYRNTYDSAIGNLGLDGIIESMKQSNAEKL